MKRLAATLLAGIFVVAGVTAGCFAQPKSVVIGYQAVPGALPLFVAQDRGFFARHGLAAELRPFASPALAIEALFAGQVDAITTTYLSAFQFALQHQTYGRILHPLTFSVEGSSSILVRTGLPVSSFADLRGHAIGVNSLAANPGILALNELLARSGMSQSDVILHEVAYPDQAAAFLAGTLDASISVTPFSDVAIGRGLAYRLEDPIIGGSSTPVTDVLGGPITLPSGEIIHAFPATALVTSDQRLGEKGDQLRALQQGLSDAAAWLNANDDPPSDDAIATVNKWLGGDAATGAGAVRANLAVPYIDGFTDYAVLQPQMDALANQQSLPSVDVTEFARLPWFSP